MSLKKLDNNWLIKLVKTVNAGASTDSIFRLFASEVSERLGLISIQVYYFDRSGNLVLRNWYGLTDDQVQNFKVLKMNQKTPTGDCAKSKEMLIFGTSKEIKDEYVSTNTWSFIPEGLACVPLKIGEAVEGVLVFSFNTTMENRDADDVSEKIIILQALAELCQLVTSRLHPENQTRFSNPTNGDTNITGHVNGKVELGEKHQRILLYIAHGYTNSEIARETHYSEATTRVEIGKLFAKLGVNNRQEAAALAHRYETT